MKRTRTAGFGPRSFSVAGSRRRHHRAVASLHHGTAGCPASRGWQGQIQCRCGVGLSSEREDGQGDVTSPHQANDRMPVAGPLAWNSLPPEIKTSLTLGQFCGRLKPEMFLRSYYASYQIVAIR